MSALPACWRRLSLHLYTVSWHNLCYNQSYTHLSALRPVQGIPLIVGAFFLLPIVCWLPCNARRALHILFDVRTWLFVMAADVLVWTFFYRAVLGGLMFVLPVLYVLSFKGKYGHILMRLRRENFTRCICLGTRRGLLTRNAAWICSSGLLGAFTFLPAVGRSSDHFSILLLGLAAWLLKLGYSNYNAAARLEPIRLLNLLLLITTACIVAYVADGFDKQRGLSPIAQIAAWLIAAVALVLPLLQSRSGRLQRIADSLCMPFALMSLSYEPLFLFVLALNLGCWVQMERRETSAAGGVRRAGGAPLSGRDFRRAYMVLVYVLLSFFGTGNLASISSFDPNAVRCFVGTFAPFVMAGLIVVKLFVPVLLVMCASTAINVDGRVSVSTVACVSRHCHRNI